MTDAVIGCFHRVGSELEQNERQCAKTSLEQTGYDWLSAAEAQPCRDVALPNAGCPSPIVRLRLREPNDDLNGTLCTPCAYLDDSFLEPERNTPLLPDT